jgi:putrescine transport system permease protein
MRRAAVLAPVWAWLGLFVAAPAVVLGVLALSVTAETVPPYAPALDPRALLAGVTDPLYLGALLASLRIAAITSLCCLAMGYPMALAIARSRHRSLLLLAVVLPFWTGFLLRITAWIGILRDDGWLNGLLLAAHVIGEPLPILHSDAAMQVGLVYAYLPFMILPLQARLAASDPALEQAAADLGASPVRVFVAVTWPLSMPAVWAGLALVFIPVTGEIVIPDLLGDPATLTFGRAIWEAFFFERDWPQAAALAVILLTVPCLAWLARMLAGRRA